MSGDDYIDKKVAGWATVSARSAAPFEADLLAVFNASGNTYCDLARSSLDTAAVAGDALVLDNLASATTGNTGLTKREEPLIVVEHAAAVT